MFSFLGGSPTNKDEEVKENTPPASAHAAGDASAKDDLEFHSSVASNAAQTSSESPALVKNEDGPSVVGDLVINAVEASEKGQVSELVSGREDVPDTDKVGDVKEQGLNEQDGEEQITDEYNDLDLIAQYDNSFNEFITAHPNFLISNPDLVHNLRVAKLRKLLESFEELENGLIRQLQELEASRPEVEMELHKRLMDASRKKAAREIHLQSQLSELRHRAKEMDAKLKWQLVTDSEKRAKKHYNLRQNLKNEVTSTDRLELLKILPGGDTFQGVRNAVLAPPSAPSANNDDEDRRQFQVDNAFLNAQVIVLKKKLEYQKIAAKKHAWVESVLVRMDPKVLNKLKAKHQKKAGVVF